MRIVRSLLSVLSLIVLACASLSPVSAEETLKVKFTCPIGGETFTADLGGTFTQIGIRLDMRPIGSVAASPPFPVCPSNGFVMFQPEFTAEQLKQLEPIVASNEYQQARKDNSDYYMVAYMRERLGADPLEIARDYLRASWEAEGSFASDPTKSKECAELVARYRTLALAKFDAFLAKETIRTKDWWTSQILSAEIERLLGRFDAALARLDKLPVENLLPNAGERKAIDQVRMYAQSKNAEPQRFVRKAAAQ